MSSDPLSDALRAVDCQGAVFFAVDATAPWVAAAPAACQVAAHVRPGARHVIEFHVVLEGTCWASVAGEPAFELGPGDVLLLPQGDAHVLASEPTTAGDVDLGFYASLATANLPIALHLGEGAGSRSVRLVCGFLGSAAGPFDPLLRCLPRVLLDRASDGGDRDYIRTFVERAAVESAQGGAGSACVLTRLSELMFVEVLRRHLASLPKEQSGWLAAIRDPVVGRAIAAVHERPGRKWTLEDLAAAASASRTVLAERFKERVGVPPMQYLAQWRMQLACRRLEDGHDSLARISADLGYASEAAFQRAFKQVVGVPPGAFRRGVRA